MRRARELETHAVALVAITTLPAAQRARLSRARLLVREAEALVRAGDVQAALERARRSEAELRGAVGPALLAAERYRSRAQVATWQRWIDDTRRVSRATGQPAILVLKEKNLLILLSRGVPVKRYDAEVGANALGVKARQGDRATPEGRYRIVEEEGPRPEHLLPRAAARLPERRRSGALRGGQAPRRDPARRRDRRPHRDPRGRRARAELDGRLRGPREPDMDDLFARVGIGTRVTIVGGDGSDGAFSSLLERVGQEGS